MTALPCAGTPDDWFSAATEEAAKTACGRCPARDACLELALAGNEQWGVWGGKSSEERAALTEDPDALPGMPAVGEAVAVDHSRAAYVANAHGTDCKNCARENAEFVADWRAGKRVKALSHTDHAGQQMTFDLEATA